MFWLFEITPESYKMGEISLWSEGTVNDSYNIDWTQIPRYPRRPIIMLTLINFFLMLSSSVSSVWRNTKNLRTQILLEGIVISEDSYWK